MVLVLVTLPPLMLFGPSFPLGPPPETFPGTFPGTFLRSFPGTLPGMFLRRTSFLKELAPGVFFGEFPALNRPLPPRADGLPPPPP